MRAEAFHINDTRISHQYGPKGYHRILISRPKSDDVRTMWVKRDRVALLQDDDLLIFGIHEDDQHGGLYITYDINSEKIQHERRRWYHKYISPLTYIVAAVNLALLFIALSLLILT